MQEKSKSGETVILVQMETEIEAAMLVDALKDKGIEAMASGAIASGFRAEAPGYVNVLVHQSDVERAKAAAEAFSNEHFNIDWDNVDVDANLPDEDE
ncbi:hypothetical protein KS4_23110 [Poriferisphaera corsica]|uniref:DUF2007 domain-containing protein n=1 Tax=Poriferisphaera corsica TaxID=2528020 RepID=A0A517YVL6_9BACT|nr:DUF2007 domain-containing protein [Poriferisphaera corsica]QDU34246.1 hypothetical protein KS4_23110 [Poriferisphaera corsica]